jgi:hypothetical protein
MHPNDHHLLVARIARNGGAYYLEAAPGPTTRPITDGETKSAAMEKRMSPQEIQEYVRSQIFGLGSRAKVSFIVGEERVVKSGDSYFSLVNVDFHEEPGPFHNECDQPLSVLVSAAGVPVAIYVGLATCPA